ncbi:putative acyl-CoA dehydrogenase [delta proteobacterium NaphS2]|nr:putative acyl-CoA dehydrogenase [delta proteobacterium NaphS2]
MDNLLNILGSFNPDWRGKKWADDFVSVIKETVLPSYPFLYAKLENNKAVFPDEWSQIITALKEADIFKLFVPARYGNQKASEEDIYFMMELLGYASPGLGVVFASHGRAVDIILQGTDAQKDQYLPMMAEGAFGAIAMTEKSAGSDAGGIGLMARKNGAGYLFNGEKIFISNSGLAEIYTVLANTKGVKGPRSLSLFIVESSTPNFTVRKLPEKDGLKILPTGRLIFEDAPVPGENLVGDEGRGLIGSVNVIDRGKIHIAGICCGLAYRIFREVFHYVQRREQFDHPLTQSQDISFQISDMFTKMTAARGLCFHALKQIGTPYYGLSSAQAKLFASQMVMETASRAQILMGGRGYFKNDLVNQLSSDARGMEYLEGTSNVQKMLIGKHLFRSYRE